MARKKISRKTYPMDLKIRMAHRLIQARKSGLETAEAIVEETGLKADMLHRWARIYSHVPPPGDAPDKPAKRRAYVRRKPVLSQIEALMGGGDLKTENERLKRVIIMLLGGE